MSQKPEVFGKYILLQKVAMGGMAEIYLAKAPQAEGVAKFVAIKRILPQFSAAEEFISMFKEEAKIAVNLSHRNVVSIYEFDVEKGQFYIAMEYVEGKNLRQILNRLTELHKDLPVEVAVYVINEVARGLDHAHRCIDKKTGKSLNIIHRDISPQNFMISFEGDVKIVDFGIAKAESKVEATKTGTLKGKFSYMSPEQADGETLDPRTDVFSVGIILWELLANERLFVSNNEINILKKIRECNIPPLRKMKPDLDPELERITAKALARDRDLRYQSAADLHKDLNRFINTKYPDFGSQDFSNFVKHLFAEEIIEARKKTIEYAEAAYGRSNVEKTMIAGADDDEGQIQKGHSSSRGSTNATTTETEKEARPDTSTETEKEAGPMGLLPIDAKEASVSNYSVEQVTKSGAGSIPPSSPPPALKERTVTRTGSGASGLSVENTNSRPVSETTSFDYSEPSSSSSSMTFGIVAVIALAGLSWFFVKFFPSKVEAMKCTVGLGTDCEALASLNRESGQAQQASKNPTIPLLFQTQPGGAEIFINGVSKGFTPAEIQVPPNQPLQIRLQKEGYAVHTANVMATAAGQGISATLQRAAVGYLDIEVPFSNSVVYINERQLEQRPPITRHMVQANTAIVVKAYDPLTGNTAQQSITVQQNQVQRVILYPNRR